MALDPSALDDLITTRRTTKMIDPDRAVDRSVIDQLCELATWAPNHRRTDPWRFAVFTGAAREQLGNTIADVLVDLEAHEAKIKKTRTKYLRASTIVVVGSTEGPDEVTTSENRDAVAAGINNLLLGAHARGLATLWSTVATPTAPALLDLCGFPPSSFCVGAIYLGYPTGAEAPGFRAAPQIQYLGD